MRRKITVYGLRFSKTSFWNRLNTGFPDPAVATVLTACGIETLNCWYLLDNYQLQQYLPLAVLKLAYPDYFVLMYPLLQQYLPLAVLKLSFLWHGWLMEMLYALQQYLPLAVLKRPQSSFFLWFTIVALQQYLPLAVLKPGYNQVMSRIFHNSCNSTYRLRYWNSTPAKSGSKRTSMLQQYLPLAVLKLVSERAYNIFVSGLQQYLPLAVLKLLYVNPSS